MNTLSCTTNITHVRRSGACTKERRMSSYSSSRRSSSRYTKFSCPRWGGSMTTTAAAFAMRTAGTCRHTSWSSAAAGVAPLHGRTTMTSSEAVSPTGTKTWTITDEPTGVPVPMMIERARSKIAMRQRCDAGRASPTKCDRAATDRRSARKTRTPPRLQAQVLHSTVGRGRRQSAWNRGQPHLMLAEAVD